MEKYFFSYEDIHKTSLDIATRVKASGFEPDVIVAIGSGGFIPARIHPLRKPAHCRKSSPEGHA